MTTTDARKRLAEQAATQADTSVEAVALRVLSAHNLSSGGRNLGQYRTEWTCICDGSFVTDGHRGESVKSGMDAHVAAALADALNGAGVTGGGV